MLHLGNVYFHRKQLKHGQEGVEIGSDAEIRWTGHLLRLDVDGIKEALTTKTTVRVCSSTSHCDRPVEGHRGFSSVFLINFF